MTAPTLKWLPKPTSAGDIEGGGTKRLLGQPDLGLLELLVRETAQNSWDARIEGQVPIFDLRVRTLDQTQKRALRTLVFPNADPGLGLLDCLEKPELSVLEIHDRNTNGLSGPTRNDMAIPQGQPKNFVDFVLNVGSGRAGPEKGGTYGFGKTASYLASRCSTILIWTRTLNTVSELEHRLIASAVGDGFVLDGRQFTGRHWWGDPDVPSSADSFVVSPVIGASAQTLGELLFDRHFPGDSTGTSIMVIDPVDEILDEDLASALSTIAVNNLWPKLPTHQDPLRRMDVHLSDGEGAISVERHLNTEVMRLKMRALEAIRARQSGSDEEEDPAVEVHEIHCYRPQMLVGHLALAKLAASQVSTIHHLDDAEKKSIGLNSLTTMRHSAELVVHTEFFGARAGKPHNWVGVFKPTLETDRFFALSEPPAHDTWSPNGPGLSDEPHGKRYVNMGIKRYREQIKKFLAPPENILAEDDVHSTANLSSTLAGLTGAVGPGSLVGPTGGSGNPTPSAARGSAKRPQAVLFSTNLLPIADGDSHQLASVLIQTDGPPGELLLEAERLSLAVDGASIQDDGVVRVQSWFAGSVQLPAEDGKVRVTAGTQVQAIISFPRGLAIDVRFRARCTSPARCEHLR